MATITADDYFAYYREYVLPKLNGPFPHNFDVSTAISLSVAKEQLGIHDPNVITLEEMNNQLTFNSIAAWMN